MNKANLNEGYKPELSLLETRYRYPPLRPQTMIGSFKYWNKYYFKKLKLELLTIMIYLGNILVELCYMCIFLGVFWGISWENSNIPPLKNPQNADLLIARNRILLYCILCNSSLHKFFQSTFLMKSMEPWHCMFIHTFNSITLTKYNKLIEYKSVYCTIFCYFYIIHFAC